MEAYGPKIAEEIEERDPAPCTKAEIKPKEEEKVESKESEQK
jgi:hypothetical protein